MKHHIYKAAWDFFDNCLLSIEVNCTLVTLVPKIAPPFYVKEFRRVAC